MNALEGTLLDLVAHALDTPIERLDRSRLLEILRETLGSTDWREDERAVESPEPARLVDAVIEARLRRAWKQAASFASKQLGIEPPSVPSIAIKSEDLAPKRISALTPFGSDTPVDQSTLVFDTMRHLVLGTEAGESQVPVTEEVAEIVDNARRNSAMAQRSLELDPMIGRTLKGKYRIDGQLGRGGAGTVYIAEDLHIGAKVAVKLLNPEAGRRPDAIESFIAEAKLLTTVDHENIVRWITFDETEDGSQYFVMEYIDGKELSVVLEEHGGRLPWKRSVCIALQVLNALERAHDLPNGESLLHLDLKPQNVFVLDDPIRDLERVKVIDFGIGQYVGNLVEIQPETDNSAALCDIVDLGATFTVVGPAPTRDSRRARGGTPLFASPEQAEHLLNLPEVRALDSRSDIYSLGVMLFYMISGEFPFERSNQATETLAAHIEKTPRRLRATGVRVSRRVDDFVDRCLRKDPDQRWPDTTSARIALERIVHPQRRIVTALLAAVIGLSVLAVWLARPKLDLFELHVAQDNVVLFGQQQPTRGAPEGLAIPVAPSSPWSVRLESPELHDTPQATARVIDPTTGEPVPIEASRVGKGVFELSSLAKTAATAPEWIQLQLDTGDTVRSSRHYWVRWVTAPALDEVIAWIDSWVFRNADKAGIPDRAWDPSSGITIPRPIDHKAWREVSIQLDGSEVGSTDLLGEDATIDFLDFLQQYPLGNEARPSSLTIQLFDLCGQSISINRTLLLAPKPLELIEYGIAERMPNSTMRRDRRLIGPGHYVFRARLNRPGRIELRLVNHSSNRSQLIEQPMIWNTFEQSIDELFPGLEDGSYELTIRAIDDFRDHRIEKTMEFGWRNESPVVHLVDTAGRRILPGGSLRVSSGVGTIEVQLGAGARPVFIRARVIDGVGAERDLGSAKISPESAEHILPVALDVSGRYRVVLGLFNDDDDIHGEESIYEIVVDQDSPTIEVTGLTKAVDADQLAQVRLRVHDTPFSKPRPKVRVELAGEMVDLSWQRIEKEGWRIEEIVGSGLPDGEHLLSVTATDGVGNARRVQHTLILSRRSPILVDRMGSGDWPVRRTAGPDPDWVRRWDLAYTSEDTDVISVEARIHLLDDAIATITLPLISVDHVFRVSDEPALTRANIPPSWAGQTATVEVIAVDRGGNRWSSKRTARLPDRSNLPLPDRFELAGRELVLIDPADPEYQMEGRVYEFGGRRREQETPHFNHGIAPSRQHAFYLARLPEGSGGVTWDEAAAAAAKLGARLPTWYEWEFASRGGRRYWTSYQGSKLMNHRGDSQLARSYEWTRSAWPEGTPRLRRQHAVLDAMIFGHNPSSPRRFVAVTGGFDRFEPTDRGVKTVSDGHSIGFRLTLDVPSLGRLLEREWGLRP